MSVAGSVDGISDGLFGNAHQPKPKDRQIERIALTVFSTSGLVLENGLEGVICSQYGAHFATKGVVPAFISRRFRSLLGSLARRCDVGICDLRTDSVYEARRLQFFRSGEA